MAIERLVGLHVTDDDLYQKYRDGMFPILEEYSGGFGYDFKVSDVLKSEVEMPINRVFTIYFENKDAMNAFFSNEKYLKIKNKFFEPSVAAVTVISVYER